MNITNTRPSRMVAVAVVIGAVTVAGGAMLWARRNTPYQRGLRAGQAIARDDAAVVEERQGICAATGRVYSEVTADGISEGACTYPEPTAADIAQGTYNAEMARQQTSLLDAEVIRLHAAGAVVEGDVPIGGDHIDRGPNMLGWCRANGGAVKPIRIAPNIPDGPQNYCQPPKGQSFWPPAGSTVCRLPEDSTGHQQYLADSPQECR